MPQKIQFKCGICDSTKVVFSGGDVKWDFAKQQFVADTNPDNAFCHNCHEDTEIKTVASNDPHPEPNNETRAARAHLAITAWIGTDTAEEEPQTTLIDLLTDLRHYCDATENVNLLDAMSDSYRPYLEERNAKEHWPTFHKTNTPEPVKRAAIPLENARVFESAVISKMLSEDAINNSDAEIDRCLDGCVSGRFLKLCARVLRDNGFLENKSLQIE